ncbi:SCD [Cordylochernes scorpioides]|uniref:SCD n=1 Tax=Cordylochernes scorpioides TaxID=51811 RepID=A0ABY6LR48_9ARAC|nr:SCD [Cordylochernes scorpioides]
MFKMKLEELREKNIPASDDLVYTFNQRILEAMSSAKITYSIKGGPRKSKPWFDKDCYDMKKLAKESLKKYRKTNRLEDRECYASSRKKYLALLDLKRKGFDNEKQEILRNAKDSKTFWKTIALYKSTSIIQGEISMQDWLNFYRELMTTEKNLRICNLHNVISQNDPLLDSEITNADIYKEIAGLRSNKACGPDGIPNEVLKTLPDSYILLLKQLYNSVMTTGKYPAIWTNSTIHPIFKNGYKNSPSNYREFGDIHLLLYADDIAIIGESRTNLQKKIKILKEYLDENLMTLNESKSKIMVFRNGVSTIGAIFDLSKMAPNTTTTVTEVTRKVEVDKVPTKSSVVWKNVAIFVVLHSGAIYGLYLGITTGKWQSWVFAILMSIASGLGVTAGAHRLWSHRAYKARWPLRLLLAIFNCIACQNDIYEWSRDHRVHHKYSETDADPHNVNRGFFFAHMGWLMCRKHPEVISKGKSVDLSDLMEDPIVRLQRKFYVPLVVLFNVLVPMFLPHYCWEQDLWSAFWGIVIARYTISLHFTWLVNSAAHTWGQRPFDRHISARENHFVALGALGEGFHNYHHTFPWDYSTSELGWKLNLSTMFIDGMAKIGMAYDLRSVSPEVLHQRMARTGDDSKTH